MGQFQISFRRGGHDIVEAEKLVVCPETKDYEFFDSQEKRVAIAPRRAVAFIKQVQAPRPGDHHR